MTVNLLRSQDLHFSQFNENPSLINPALTGATSPIRASVNNKDQWRSITNAYKTFGASFETRFNPSSWQQVDKFRSMTFKEKSVGRLAAGISFYNDKAGDGNMGLTQTNLSLATFIPISKKSFFSLGIQASLAQRKVDQSKLIFSNQYNGSVYDPNQTSRENFSSLNYSYTDLGAGILWSYSADEKKLNGNKQIKANIGFAVYHLTRPHQNYFISDNRLFMKYVIHGDFLVSLKNPNKAIAPTYLLQMQGSSVEFLLGTMFKYYMNSDSKYTGIVKRNCIGYGVYYRNNDAIIVSMLLEWQEQFAVIMSYDLNVSPLVTASSMRGGFEITLRYTPPKAFLYQKKETPP